jgi:hypothetical protein
MPKTTDSIILTHSKITRWLDVYVEISFILGGCPMDGSELRGVRRHRLRLVCHKKTLETFNPARCWSKLARNLTVRFPLHSPIAKITVRWRYSALFTVRMGLFPRFRWLSNHRTSNFDQGGRGLDLPGPGTTGPDPPPLGCFGAASPDIFDF